MYQRVGITALKNKLTEKQGRVQKRYQYYDMKMSLRYFNRDMPTELQLMKSVLGWCGKAVDSMADRIVLRGFSDDNFDLTKIYQMNNMDILCDSAVLAALIGSCAFIYISTDESGFPRMRVLDAYNATGVIDPVTYMLHEGYAILERDSNGTPQLEAYFEPGATTYYERGREPYTILNAAPYSLLVPIIYRPDATRAFGHSRISRACMDLTQMAMRTIKRSDIASEFYSYPQRYVLGMDSDSEMTLDKWKMAMSAFFRVDKDEDGDRPTVGQFQQQTMTPFVDQLRMIAGAFAGETGLTIDDLGFPSQNPSSSDAIKASHEQLRLTARKAQRTFGTGFLNAGYLCACIRDNYGYLMQQIYLTKPLFDPLFEPDSSQLGVIGDAIYKIQQAFPDYFDEEKLKSLTGI